MDFFADVNTVEDVVWAKASSFPYWPAVLFNPAKATKQVLDAKSAKGDPVLVCFFGSNNLYAFHPHFKLTEHSAWVERTNVTAYETKMEQPAKKWLNDWFEASELARLCIEEIKSGKRKRPVEGDPAVKKQKTNSEPSEEENQPKPPAKSTSKLPPPTGSKAGKPSKPIPKIVSKPGAKPSGKYSKNEARTASNGTSTPTTPGTPTTPVTPTTPEATPSTDPAMEKPTTTKSLPPNLAPVGSLSGKFVDTVARTPMEMAAATARARAASRAAERSQVGKLVLSQSAIQSANIVINTGSESPSTLRSELALSSSTTSPTSPPMLNDPFDPSTPSSPIPSTSTTPAKSISLSSYKQSRPTSTLSVRSNPSSPTIPAPQSQPPVRSLTPEMERQRALERERRGERRAAPTWLVGESMDLSQPDGFASKGTPAISMFGSFLTLNSHNPKKHDTTSDMNLSSFAAQQRANPSYNQFHPTAPAASKPIPNEAPKPLPPLPIYQPIPPPPFAADIPLPPSLLNPDAPLYEYQPPPFLIPAKPPLPPPKRNDDTRPFSEPHLQDDPRSQPSVPNFPSNAPTNQTQHDQYQQISNYQPPHNDYGKGKDQQDRHNYANHNHPDFRNNRGNYDHHNNNYHNRTSNYNKARNDRDSNNRDNYNRNNNNNNNKNYSSDNRNHNRDYNNRDNRDNRDNRNKKDGRNYGNNNRNYRN